MAPYSLAPVVEGELDDIWVNVARDKGSFEVASDVIASLEERFRALAAHPYIGRQRDYDIGPELGVFLPASL